VEDRTVRVEGHGGAAGEGGGVDHDRLVDRRAACSGRAPGRGGRRTAAPGFPGGGQGSRAAVQPLPHTGRPWGRLTARTGDEVHGRGDGRRPVVRGGVREVPGGCVRIFADPRNRVRLGGQPGQTFLGLPGEATGRSRVQGGRHRGHGGRPAAQRRRVLGGA